MVNNEKIGEIQVCYLQQQPESHEGPFLKEERQLIGAVAERLGGLIERKHAEDDRWQRQNQYQSLVNNIPGTTYRCVLDADWTMYYMSKDVEVLTGYPASDFINNVVRTYESVIYPEDSSYVERSVNNAVEAGKPWEIEYRVCHKDGSIRWVYEKGQGVPGQDGKVAFLDGFIQDITANKKAEQEIRALSKFPGENPNPILRVNSDGTVLYSNPAGKLLLGNWGCDVGEKIPEKWQELVVKALESATNSSAAEEEEEEEVNGKIFLFSLAPILDANYVNIYGRNITEYKQSFEKLEYAKELAEAANEAKGQFLANMSHEIRTPMNSIIGFSDILIEEQMPDDQKEYVSLIRESGRHLLELINDILDFSKVEAGKLDVQETVFFLSELVETVESAMRPAAEKKGLKFEIVNRGQLPQQIRSDPNRLRQCLLNLVGNAIKFTDNGCVQVEVSLEGNDDKQFIRFDVEDTGIGIPADSQKKIFESFRQVDGTDSRQYGGTGLGLTITKQLAELLGGEISVKSEFGKGTIFSLVIPTNVETGFQELLENVEEDIQLDDNPKYPGHIEFTGRVLVAEDVLTNQKLIKHLLEKIGFEVTMVDDGNKVVQKALSQSFDLIFMDIQMPNMNGYEATKIIRDNSIKTPIIALTANAMSGDDVNCIRSCA